MAAILAGIGSAAEAVGTSGLGSVLGNALGGSGSFGNILGSLVGDSLQSDANKDTGGALNMLGAPQGAQTGAASTQQQAQAPQSLSANNTNQYNAPAFPTFNGISGNNSPFNELLGSLLSGPGKIN